jgi:hypothetical protein
MIYWIVSPIALMLMLSLYVNFVLYRKVAFYEEWYEQFASNVEAILINLQRMDALGAMESDDEVGYFFEALKELMVELFDMGFYDQERVDEIREDLDIPREEGQSI